MSRESKQLARLAILALLGIETLAAYGLLRRTSTPPVIFGFYSLQYFPLVVAFLGLWLATLYLLLRPSARLAAAVADAASWLRARWWLAALLLYGALEGWYALIGLAQRVFFPTMARRSAMTAVLLFLIWVGLVLLFAGRSRAERRTTVALLGVASVSVLISFWLVSQAVILVTAPEAYAKTHPFWSSLHRYDYVLGYRGRPNTEFVHHHCPAEVGDVTIFTDDLGYRNLPGAKSAPLVVVGSSFVYEGCKDYEDMWSSQLGEILGVEVANYSTVAMSLYHSNKFTDLFVRQGEHEVLVYGIGPRDLMDDASYDVSLHDRLAASGILYYMSPVNYTFRRYLTKSPAVQIGRGITRTRTEQATTRKIVTLDNGVQLDEFGGLPNHYLGPDSIVGQRLETAIALADEMGLEFAVVMIPSKQSVYPEAYREAFPQRAHLPDEERQTYDEICAWLAEREIPCLNLTDDLRRAAQEEPALYFSTDGHWNTLGSRLAAERTADFLRENLPADALD